MPKQRLEPFFLMRITWWSTLFAGAFLGIASQRIPEIKAIAEPYVDSIEKHPIVKEFKTKAQSLFPQLEVASGPIEYSHYSEGQPLLGQPISSFIIHRPGYSAGYDGRTRNPIWVYEHLTADNLKGNTDRSQLVFHEDETIPKHLRAVPEDYKGHGLDHGHMAPAADHATNLQTMNDTFYLTNICPQCPQLNRDYWAKLEKQARDFTREYPHVYVITGPLYLPYQEGKRRFVKYQVIGTNEVAVPSHFFKVIATEDDQGKRKVQAYILPNTVIPTHTPLETFKTTTQKVEKAAGILLFNQNSNATEKNNPY